MKNVSLQELDDQQSSLYRWRYFQYGPVTFNITEEDFDPVTIVTDIRPMVPWFLACNPDRYPYWYGEPDPRNKNLWAALHSGSYHSSMEERKKLFPYIPNKLVGDGDILRLFFTPTDKDGALLVS